MLSVANAQSVQQDGNSGYNGPEDAGTRAAMAQLRERLHQCHLLLIQARATIKKNELIKAEGLLKQALSLNPDNGEARVRLAEMHIRSRQPSAVVADLEPIVNPRPNFHNSVGSDVSVCMLYVLAQIDCGNWAPAEDCYQKTFRPELTWHLPGGGPEHTFPDVQFSPDNPDFSGLRAQAYLIRGASSPEFVEEKDQPPYMLENLRQALKYNPRSLDANYLSGFMLVKMERFPEARAAFDKAMRMASKEARPEVKQALEALKVKEDAKREYEARANAKH
jgi:tetratricopeptide (TPR) repeat protein